MEHRFTDVEIQVLGQSLSKTSRLLSNRIGSNSRSSDLWSATLFTLLHNPLNLGLELHVPHMYPEECIHKHMLQ